MSRSSTSSSEGPGSSPATQPADPSPSTAPADSSRAPLLSTAGKRALLLSTAILLVLEFGIARTDWVWRLDPRRPVGIMLAVEEEIVAPSTDPRVVILGSSVMRDAVLPGVFEGAAGLPGGSVLNTSLPNATPFDFVVFYERNREALRGTRLLIVGVEDWYFYEEPSVSERYHRWASLGDRWSDYRGSERLPLLVSWIWKTYAARQAFALDGLAAAARGERADVIGDDRRVQWRPRDEQLGADDFDLAPYEARLRGRQWRDRQSGYLVELVGLAAADNLPVVIVRMPMRRAAFRLRTQIDPGAESRLQGVFAEVQQVEAPSGILDLPSGETAGLEDRYFLDERHLGTRGAEMFSRFLAGWAAEQYDLH